MGQHLEDWPNSMNQHFPNDPTDDVTMGNKSIQTATQTNEF